MKHTVLYTFSSVGHPADSTSPASEASRLAASANKSVDHSETGKARIRQYQNLINVRDNLNRKRHSCVTEFHIEEGGGKPKCHILLKWPFYFANKMCFFKL